MTDEELITALRMWSKSELCREAADRIEALVKREAKLSVLLNAAGTVADMQKQRADALRLQRAAMHRRAQRAEGKAHRSAHLLEAILRSIKESIPMLPTLPSPYPLSLHILYHRIRAARDHARASSGRA